MNKIKFSHIVFCLLFIFLVLQISQQSELGGETWGYWFFNKVFKRDGTFIIPERSPIYVLYLSLFSWLEYPFSFMAERFITSLFVISILYIFFVRYLGRNIALLATFIWAPFIISAEPPTQAMAIGINCLAMIVRNKKNLKRYNYTLSYSLFAISYLLRVTNIFFLIFFIGYDVFRKLKESGIKGLCFSLKPRMAVLPLLLVGAMGMWMANSQSSHRWNNAWFADTKWFPSNGKTLRDAGFLQGFNQSYILHQGKNISGQDFYFTNKVVFKGATTMMAAVKSNPTFVFTQLKENANIWLHDVFSFLLLGELFFPFTIFAVLALVVGIFFSSFKPDVNKDEVIIFVIASIALVTSSILVLPNMRYLPPLLVALPLIIFLGKQKIKIFVYSIFENPKIALMVSAIVIGISLLPLLTRLTPIRLGIVILTVLISSTFYLLSYRKFDLFTYVKRITPSSGIKLLATFVLVLIFRMPVEWRNGIKFQSNIENNNSFSPKKSHKEIMSLISNCRGVMSLESNLLAGLYNVDDHKIYNIFEIPPFGKLGDPSYNGLEAKRIDCLLLSSALTTYNPSANSTNANMRYQNYIAPYAEILLKKGALQCEVANFGKVIILPKLDKLNLNCVGYKL